MRNNFNEEVVAARGEAFDKFPARIRIGRVLDSFIFYALLLVIALACVPYGTVEPWWESLVEMCVIALGGLWLIEGLLGGGWHVKGKRLLVPLLVLLGFVILQIVPLGVGGGETPLANAAPRTISADPYETRLFIYKLLACILTLALLLRYTSSRRRLRVLIWTVIGVAIASAGFGIIRQTMQGNELGFGLPYLKPTLGYGQFINRNHFAFLMEMALGLIFGIIAGRGVKRERLLLYVAASLPIWTALVLANSRGGIFALLTQVLLTGILFTLIRPPFDETRSRMDETSRLARLSKSLAVRVVLIVCLTAAVFTGIVWMGGDPLATRLEAISGEVSAETESAEVRSGSRRQEMWGATWKMIVANPIWGVGFNGYWIAIPKYHSASGVLTPQQAHNDYLEILASGGIIGGALALWFVVMLIGKIRHRLRSPDAFRRAACFGAIVGLFGVAVHSFFDFGLHITINSLIFIALVVIATVDERVENLRNVRGRRGRNTEADPMPSREPARDSA